MILLKIHCCVIAISSLHFIHKSINSHDQVVTNRLHEKIKREIILPIPL